MTSPSNSQDRQSQSRSRDIHTIRTERGSEASPDTARGATRTTESQSRTTYGTIDSQDVAGLESRPEETHQHPPVTTYEPIRLPLVSGQSSERNPKKPPTIRRASTKPYRGQEFSVDDDPKEYEEDNALYRHVSGRSTASLRRRGPHAQQPALQRVDSTSEGADDMSPAESSGRLSGGGGEPSGLSMSVDGDDDSRSDVSDAESFTLKDRQQAINETHPFGIRIWKPALYKKFRSVEKTAEGDIHSVPGERVSNWISITNFLWSIIFGWWLALTALLGAVVCVLFAFSPDAKAYAKVFSHLSLYLLYPFGSFVRLESDENYADEDEGEGRSISEYEQWQSGDLEHGRLFFGPVAGRSLVGRRRNSLESASEHDSLLGRTGRSSPDEGTSRIKRRFFGRGEWTIGRVIFYTWFYLVVGPLMLLVSLVCWMMVFWIPMGRVTIILFYHLRRHPLALSFHSDATYTRSPSRPSSSILLCTYRAAGYKYWKYTIDGTNIFFINLLAVVLFTILDYFVLSRMLQVKSWITHPGLIFSLALVSIIPLAYFIGQAVASISAQSSMGLGAAVNAFFSTVVEVYLYCIALTEGKAQLVEGSIIGSIFTGILFLPGLSMCFGAIRRKTQRFNVKSAGVTSTMLLFAVIAAFGPTLFYQVYGTHELRCMSCTSTGLEGERDCRRCYFSEIPAINDKFFLKAVQPYSWFAALLLFLSYVIGLWFTLRTHAAVIWATELDEKKTLHTPHSHTSHLTLQESTGSIGKAKHSSANGQQVGPGGAYQPKGSIRDSQLYARILGQSLKHVGLVPANDCNSEQPSSTTPENQNITPHLVPPKHNDITTATMSLPGLSDEQNEIFVRKVTEVAATAAAVAARDAANRPRKPPAAAHTSEHSANKHVGGASTVVHEDGDEGGVLGETHVAAGGHDAPNWSKMKSSVILLGATLLYAVIAEILVNTVDSVLDNVDIDEKFLGITLFALVPNTTEFLNAISFAMNGNIALSMEIGSAYALQVCLLQIPAVVIFSAIYAQFVDPKELLQHSFNLIFPQWDMITVILCVFLLSYMYGEGKSNYFKGSILVLTYLFVIFGFYLSDFNDINARRVDPTDSLAVGESAVFRTVGRGKGGRAY
ncbi:calcium/proton exchanger [Emergomyces pasteurianus Ep9510]|uniref:Calcium/proton exchanger n=1 Tax=Emergomyces pasteurianus Ep9510 TaxID=1447872 RepID=A0A1J9Q688_9EURO|nr:calcium/proton exchanger [Emergomyces pasteurianus Ep9510]